MAEGKEDRGVHQTLVIQIGGQNGVHFFKDTAAPSSLDTSVVEASLHETITGAKTLAELLAKKEQLLKEVRAKQASLKEAHDYLLGQNKLGSETQAALTGQFEAFADHKYDSGRSHGMVEWMEHDRQVWGRQPTPGDWRDRNNDHYTEEAKAKTRHDEVNASVATLAQTAANSRTCLEGALKLGREIDEIQAQLARLDQQILAAAKR